MRASIVPREASQKNAFRERNCGDRLEAPLHMVCTCRHLCGRWLPMARPSETRRGSHSKNASKTRNPDELANRGAWTVRLAVHVRVQKGHAVCRNLRVVGGHVYAKLRKKFFAPQIFGRRVADCPTALTCLCGPHYRTLLRARAWRIARLVGLSYGEMQTVLQTTRFEATRTRTAGESGGLSWPSVRDIVACTYRTTIAHR